MDSVDRRLILGAAGLAGIAALSRRSGAGPLEPPPGPIAPTGKTLQQVYDKIATGDAGTPEARSPVQGLPGSPEAQYVISQPGAYYLTGNITQSPGKACIDIQCDHVDIDGGGFTFVGSPGASSSCVRALSRTAIELYDCAFRGWQGCCCDCAECDDVSISDCLFHACSCPSDASTGQSGAVIRCRDRCEVDDVCVSACDGCTIDARHSCTINDFSIADSTGDCCRCGDGCCVSDGSILNCNLGPVAAISISTGMRCLVTECDVRNSNGLSITTGDECVVECCECTGGTGGVIHCANGCCVDDCTTLDNTGPAIECGARCSITDNKALDCAGIILGAECCCCDNEVSSNGGGGGGGAVGGAITVTGERCCVSGNFVSAGGIVVLLDGRACLIEDNHIVGAGGTPGTGGGFIFLAQGVTGCTVRSNHIRRTSTTNALVIPPGNSYGPLANAIAGGDLSTIPGGSHPHANFVY